MQRFFGDLTPVGRVQVEELSVCMTALIAKLGETKDRATSWRLSAHSHSLGAEKSAAYFEIMRHGLEISENVARTLRQAGSAESLQMNAKDYGENE